MAVPAFDDVWNSFPDHETYANMGALYGQLGGQAADAISWDGFGEDGNTCASRISVALNGSSTPIDYELARKLGLATLRTANADYIIYRVASLRTYLEVALGAPTIAANGPSEDQYGGKRGIVAFNVDGWKDATGHMALFDGQNYREETHDDVPIVYPDVRVVGIKFWQLD